MYKVIVKGKEVELTEEEYRELVCSMSVVYTTQMPYYRLGGEYTPYTEIDGFGRWN